MFAKDFSKLKIRPIKLDCMIRSSPRPEPGPGPNFWAPDRDILWWFRRRKTRKRKKPMPPERTCPQAQHPAPRFQNPKGLD